MNKKLVKELKYELENLRKNSISIEAHNREVEKLKRDKAKLKEAISIANRALEKACNELSHSKSGFSYCDETMCYSCSPDYFREVVKSE